MASETDAKKLVLCIPGSSFSREFVQCLTNAVSQLSREGHLVQLSFAYDANVHYARSRVLLCETLRGVDQKPFDGKIEYDYLMWIDSDVLFTADDIRSLIKHDKDIVTGCYLMHNNSHYPLVQKMDDKHFLEKGHYQFLGRKDIEAKKDELFTVEYAGFGFLGVKHGVFESIKYPYFAPEFLDFGTDGKIVEQASEDVSWCMKVRQNGYQIWCDPSIKVAHQKLIPLL